MVPIANQHALTDGEAVRGMRSLGRVRTNVSGTGPARTGRYSCVRGTRCVRGQDIQPPAVFIRINPLVVKRHGGATAALPERQQNNGAENSSDEEPKTHGNLHNCREYSYQVPVADDTK